MAYNYPYDRYEEDRYRPPQLETNRSMWKLMILTILTFGLYPILFFIPFSFDLDKVAPKRDGSKTMNFLWAWLLSLFTFSLVLDIWHYGIAARVEEALEKRNINYNFSRSDFWIWFLLGTLFFIGPFIYYHKLCKAMNLLCQSYNENPT